MSAEEVNMAVSVRDSPGEIRAGNSSEKDVKFYLIYNKEFRS